MNPEVPKAPTTMPEGFVQNAEGLIDSAAATEAPVAPTVEAPIGEPVLEPTTSTTEPVVYGSSSQAGLQSLIGGSGIQNYNGSPAPGELGSRENPVIVPREPANVIELPAQEQAPLQPGAVTEVPKS